MIHCIFIAEPFVPYRVTLNATICNISVQVYSQIVYTQRGGCKHIRWYNNVKLFLIPDTVRIPTIESVNRDTPTSALVRFTVPLSEQNADYFEISYYNHTGRTFRSVSTGFPLNFLYHEGVVQQVCN